MPRLHRPPAAGERGLMSAGKGNNDNLEHIRRYVQKHERYFEALGFQRPGGLPRYYTEQRPEEWPLDLAKVERLKREEQARDRAASRSDRTASSGNVGGGEKPVGQHQVPGRPGTHTRADSRSAQTRRGRRAKRAGHGQSRIRPGCGSPGAHP